MSKGFVGIWEESKSVDNETRRKKEERVREEVAFIVEMIPLQGERAGNETSRVRAIAQQIFQILAQWTRGSGVPTDIVDRST